MTNHICPLCGIRHWDRWTICTLCQWIYGTGIAIGLLIALSIIAYYQLQ